MEAVTNAAASAAQTVNKAIFGDNTNREDDVNKGEMGHAQRHTEHPSHSSTGHSGSLVSDEHSSGGHGQNYTLNKATGAGSQGFGKSGTFDKSTFDSGKAFNEGNDARGSAFDKPIQTTTNTTSGYEGEVGKNNPFSAGKSTETSSTNPFKPNPPSGGLGDSTSSIVSPLTTTHKHHDTNTSTLPSSHDSSKLGDRTSTTGALEDTIGRHDRPGTHHEANPLKKDHGDHHETNPLKDHRDHHETNPLKKDHGEHHGLGTGAAGAGLAGAGLTGATRHHDHDKDRTIGFEDEHRSGLGGGLGKTSLTSGLGNTSSTSGHGSSGLGSSGLGSSGLGSGLGSDNHHHDTTGGLGSSGLGSSGLGSGLSSDNHRHDTTSHHRDTTSGHHTGTGAATAAAGAAGLASSHHHHNDKSTTSHHDPLHKDHHATALSGISDSSLPKGPIRTEVSTSKPLGGSTGAAGGIPTPPRDTSNTTGGLSNAHTSTGQHENTHSGGFSVAPNAPSSVTGAMGSGPAAHVGPSVSAGLAHGTSVGQKHQGADRPTEEPSSEHDHLGRRKSIPLVEGHPESSGPRTHPEGKKLPSTGVSGASSSEGTGEKYVKSTGLAAEGGDFDASRPGAGREADRLLGKEPSKPGETGVTGAGAGTGPISGHDTHGTHGTQGHDDKHGAHGHEKPSLGEKIKEKLHIGSHH